MASKLKAGTLLAALMLSTVFNVYAGPKGGRGWDDDDHGRRIRRVMLISIDGMHAVDFAICVASNTCPNLAELGERGVNYTRTTTSRPSDSFPGLMALVTGGTPRTVGAFYDVAWDRVLAPPATTTGNGLAAGTCTPGKNNGTQTEYEEGDEINQLLLNGGGAFKSVIDGGIISLDPNKFVRDPFSKPTACAPVYPWNFIRTNSIYGVIHAAGGYTAWSDKHAVYAAVNGHTDGSVPTNLDDYYSPEVNSNQISLPGVITAGTDFDCSTIQASGNATTPGNDWTTDFQAIQCYDQLKVNAIVNEINGKTHLGDANARVPNLFGMNFQAVSVGEKLIENGVNGCYTDAAGTPTPKLESEITFVDAAIGQMVSALKSRDLLDSTAIIITAKHGQSPIDPNRFFPIPGHSGTNGTSPANLLAAAGLVPAVQIAGPGPTEDDISQLWLSPGNTTVSNANTVTAVNLLETDAAKAGIGEIFYLSSLETMFNAPGVPTVNGPCCKLLPGGDPRTPDIVVAPNIGVIYTGSAKKQEEHGGFAFDDTNVMLLVSNPRFERRTIDSFVETTQVAPTILKLLGLDPDELDAVRKEGTPVLLGLTYSGDDSN
ncbi:MAG TPA: alkaline phosphatase family protein [Candidatus Limnocylindrales bacterium]|nr:alkaline phosphatase family protein [Candidatus Limnocylindrales bacterium]